MFCYDDDDTDDGDDDDGDDGDDIPDDGGCFNAVNVTSFLSLL